MRFELTTFTLATCSDNDLSNVTTGLTKGTPAACTKSRTCNPDNTHDSSGNAKDGKQYGGPIQDPRLDDLVESWSVLSEPVKAGILAMVKASTTAEGE